MNFALHELCTFASGPMFKAPLLSTFLAFCRVYFAATIIAGMRPGK